MTKQQALEIVRSVQGTPHNFAAHNVCTIIENWSELVPFRFSFKRLISVLIEHWGETKAINLHIKAEHFMAIINALVAAKYGHKAN